jgi:hypothetical protein
MSHPSSERTANSNSPRARWEVTSLFFASLSFQNDEILALDAVVQGKAAGCPVLENAFPMTNARYQA